MWNLIKRIVKLFRRTEAKQEVKQVEEMQVKMLRLAPTTPRKPSNRSKELIQQTLNITVSDYPDPPRLSYGEWVDNARKVDEYYRRRFAS